MMATTAPTARGTADSSGTIHALDKHSGLPQCGIKALVRFIDKLPPIPVDTPRADLKNFVNCKACLRVLGAPTND